MVKTLKGRIVATVPREYLQRFTNVGMVLPDGGVVVEEDDIAGLSGNEVFAIKGLADACHKAYWSGKDLELRPERPEDRVEQAVSPEADLGYPYSMERRHGNR